MASLFEQIIAGGPVMMVLFALSIFSLAVVILKFVELSKMKCPRNFSLESILRQVRDSDSREVLREYRQHSSPVVRITARTLELCSFESEHFTAEEREKELETFGADELRRVESGLSTISTVAHLSPLLGLLGTVLGMISAFRGLEQAGMKADPSMLAGGIWEALLTTAFGLILAIPLLAIHHFFEARVEEITHQMEALSSSLLRRVQPREDGESGSTLELASVQASVQ